MPLPTACSLKRRTSHALKAVAVAAPTTKRLQPRSGWACHHAGTAVRRRSASSSASRESPHRSPAPAGDAGEQCQREQAWTGENLRREFNLRVHRRELLLFRPFLAQPLLVDFNRIATAGA